MWILKQVTRQPEALMAGSRADAGSFSHLHAGSDYPLFLNGLCLPHDGRLRHVICPERIPVPLKVSAEQPAGQTMHQLGYGGSHRGDCLTPPTENPGGNKCKQGDVCKPGRLARPTPRGTVIIGAVRATAPPPAPLLLPR